jgi:phosphoglycerol transferase MdoB-like AlkP superfamily enzyme
MKPFKTALYYICVVMAVMALLLNGFILVGLWFIVLPVGYWWLPLAAKLVLILSILAGLGVWMLYKEE